MAKFDTRKRSFQSKMETVARRAQRSAKYAQAAKVTRSGRVSATVKAAF